MGSPVTWILIADGARARIFANNGPGTGLASATGVDYIADHRPTRDIGSDKPGRTQESATSARHAKAPRVDWHDFEKHLFAKEMARILDAAATARAFDSLVVVAPPKALGELRAELGKHTRAKVVGELGKDLTKVSEHDLPAHLGDLISF